jgi:hypothetical protein
VFERLLGYVDFQAFSKDNLETLEEDAFNISLPVCMVEGATHFEQA